MTTRRDPPERLLAGEIGKPHGIAGEVYVLPISDDPTRFEPGARLLHEDGRVLVVEASRRHRDRLLVKFEGLDSRADAEAVRGPLYVTGEELRELGEDEFWEHELVGCEVLDPRGTEIGRVDRVVPGSAHDLLAVATPRGEALVPVVREILVDVDVRRARIVVDAPEGLLD